MTNRMSRVVIGWFGDNMIKGGKNNTKRHKCARLQFRTWTFFEPHGLQTFHETGNDVFYEDQHWIVTQSMPALVHPRDIHRQLR